MNAYWRYPEIAGGVIVELEPISSAPRASVSASGSYST
jgi:hypothetical protein